MTKYLALKNVATKVFELDFVTIFLHPAESLLLLEWKRQINFMERKVGYRQAIDLICQYGVKNWLINAQHLYYISPEEKNWILTEWVEIACQSPLVKFGVVCYDNYNLLIDKMNFTNHEQKLFQAKGKIDYRVFMNFTCALPWILTKQDKLPDSEKNGIFHATNKAV